MPKVPKLEEVSHEMLVLLRPRVSSRVSGFPVASPCLWGKLQNLSFSKVSKQLVMSFCVANTLHTPHSTLLIPHFTLHTPHLTLHTLHFTLYTFHSTLHTLHLGKFWACNHLLHFFAFGFVILDLRCHFLSCFVFFFVIWFLSCFCHFFSFLCHFFALFLSFVCHFIVILGTGKWEKKTQKLTTMTDLLLPRGSTKYKDQV